MYHFLLFITAVEYRCRLHVYLANGPGTGWNHAVSAQSVLSVLAGPKPNEFYMFVFSNKFGGFFKKAF
jgi:hypothetical protein